MSTKLYLFRYFQQFQLNLILQNLIKLIIQFKSFSNDRKSTNTPEYKLLKAEIVNSKT